MKLKFFLSTFIIACFTLVFSSSCEKKTDCKLTVITVDSLGAPLAGVSVKLLANYQTRCDATGEAVLKAAGVSNARSTSTYTFKLPAILDINAAIGTKKGVAIIKLEEGKTVDKTVTVK